jgi:CRP-like cAMP-binding protein
MPATLFTPLRGARPAASSAPLLDLDPDLAAGLAPDEVAVARRRLVVPLVAVGPGDVGPDATAGSPAYGHLVVDGLLRREIALHDRRATELIGPGDVLDGEPALEGPVPLALRWATDERVTLAVLDGPFVAAARVWPALGMALHRRLSAQAARTSVQLAIAQLGRVDLRVLALLWHLAERWGVVTLDGTVLPLRLTHSLLGRLVGAQRPTITLALGQLAESGDVLRREDGAFVLRPGSADRLTPVAPGTPRAAAAAVGVPAVPVPHG